MSRLPLYVIIISDHNLAELRACLHYRPERLWMVVTPAMHKQAKRLERVLKQHLPDTRISQLGSEEESSLTGDFVENVMAWSRTHLLPKLQADPDSAHPVFNMTGGTKPLSFILAQAYPWAELHYQPFHTAASWLERFRLSPDGVASVLERVDLSMQDINPLDIALLYMDDIRAHSPNPVSSHARSLQLAHERLEAQKTLQSNALDDASGWALLTPLLEKLWFLEDWPPGKSHVYISWEEAGFPDNRVKVLLTRLAELAPPGTLQVDDNGMELPTPRHKKSAAWQRWVSGGWFEQLVEHWLLEGGVARTSLAPNIQLKQGDSQGREADMLLLHRNRLHVVELKSDLAERQQLGGSENQLSSLSDTLGKTSKVLVVGPAVRRRHTPEQWLEFRLRCVDNNVSLIELEGPRALDPLLPKRT